MNIVRIQNAQLAFGNDAILDHVDLTIEAGERVCLVGRNGAGKSTLLKVIDGEVQLDDGAVQLVGDTVVARLPQDPPANSEQSVYDYVAEGLAEVGDLLKDYHHTLQQLEQEHDSDQIMNDLARLQTALEAADGWQLQTRIEQVLTQLALPADSTMAALSGGWLRRVALARALVVNPDLLLLDEPTNHLDVEMVRWLEERVKDFRGAVLFISHDRAFIRHLATRIIDLDRGQLNSYPGSYDAYLELKQHQLEVEETHNAEFDKKLAQEETWIRQGIKARRTRNEGRVRALKELRKQRAQRREQQGSAKLAVQEASKSGKLVFDGSDVNLAFGDKTILRQFEFTLQRGDKVALVGPNGCGKSTLIKVLLGQQAADSGQIKLGTHLQVAYFDQHRAQLDPNLTIAENVGDGKQDVTYNGKTRHILSYLQDFLFSPKQARTPVRALSGGERNRALLAKLFLTPSNFLILDEPTNDLDIDTLELLEQIVADYQGTVILVSHDREFVDNTATSVLLFEGEGKVTEIVGGFTEVNHYLSQTAGTNSAASKSQPAASASSSSTAASKESANKGSAAPRKKLSYKLQRELEQLPQRIEALEQEQEHLQQQTSQADFFTQPHSVTAPVLERLGELEQELMAALERWDELENLQQESH
ncbi:MULTISPECIES: ATP-binding cassette ATPase Uup [Idiomarina]|uniref:ATP-binding cassette ATPase Uup n=1 Tax=Idiomarina TaxID=135575 RepID=UPI00129B2E19|nr:MULTISPECIES: ABC transporter ATP-binding protein [Idiomarina]MRJ40867.1 ABC transporter ATP-binding protein [Idiomarina sp. FeN1]NCU56671.1 ABC transporter ATP-binding protein [Idiomarina sp. FenA--70]NCU59051.1 ABC transporter ATP-binding protein [Idiomarina sp. FenBw--71]UUN14455.1 ABC transporter ATP-binding protein [Idiomarina loihiensis]